MCELMLIRLSKVYEEQVMSYKEEMLQNGDSFAGCAGLEDVSSFDEWIGRCEDAVEIGDIFQAKIISDDYFDSKYGWSLTRIF